MRWTTEKKKEILEQIKAGNVPKISRSTLWKICIENGISNPGTTKKLEAWKRSEILILKAGYIPPGRTAGASIKFCQRHNIKPIPKQNYKGRN